MRLNEILLERISGSWIKNWVTSSVRSIKNRPSIEWIAELFKNLQQNPEFKNWANDNLSHPIVIKPKILDVTDSSLDVLEAEHFFDNGIHKVRVDINLALIPKTDKDTQLFINRLATTLGHELNHALQRKAQAQKLKDPNATADITGDWFKSEPLIKNKKDEYLAYFINHLEWDSWAYQIAQEIYDKFGEDSQKLLPEIIKQSYKDNVVSLKGKILVTTSLNSMLAAVNRFENNLKVPKSEMIKRLIRELYKNINSISNK